MDEYQLVAKTQGADYVKQMVYTIGEFRCTSREGAQSAASKNQLFLIPFLTGTAVDGMKWVELTRYPTKQIPLYPLKFQSMWQLLIENWPDEKSIKQILGQKPMKVLVGELGGNPRYLQTVIKILTSMENTEITGALKAMAQFVGVATRLSLNPSGEIVAEAKAAPKKAKTMDELMKDTFNTFEGRYSIPRFVEHVGSHGIRQLISYALTQQPVSWETKIGDKTLMEIAYLGHVALLPQADDRLLIFFPLVLLHFMAVSIQDCLLTNITAFPPPDVTPTNFEREFVVGFTVLRINAKFQIARERQRQHSEKGAPKMASAKESEEPPCTCTIRDLLVVRRF